MSCEVHSYFLIIESEVRSDQRPGGIFSDFFSFWLGTIRTCTFLGLHVHNKNEDTWAYLDHCLISSGFRILLIVLSVQRVTSFLKRCYGASWYNPSLFLSFPQNLHLFQSLLTFSGFFPSFLFMVLSFPSVPSASFSFPFEFLQKPS